MEAGQEVQVWSEPVPPKTRQDVTSGQELFPQDNGRSQEGDRCPAPSM